MIRAILDLRLCNRQVVESVARSLQPDNERPPPNFKIRHLVNDKCNLVYIIDSKGGDLVKNLLTLLSIIDEISRLTEALSVLFKEISKI
ncbi:MAG: hypothetical protein J7J11_03590 [Desulfurococcales archaeon]|nr:hypothetical protein [Desulfurococcales archaeon]